MKRRSQPGCFGHSGDAVNAVTAGNTDRLSQGPTYVIARGSPAKLKRLMRIANVTTAHPRCVFQRDKRG
jgi:hypothetical protein